MKYSRRKRSVGTCCRTTSLISFPTALLCLALCILASNITAASVGAGSVTSHAVACLAPPPGQDTRLLSLSWFRWTPSATLYAAPLGVPGESGSWTACDTGEAEGVGVGASGM